MNTINKNNQSLVDLFGLDKVAPDLLEAQVAEIGTTIFEEVLVEVLPILSPVDLEEYEKLMDTNPEPDEMLNFFFEKIPNFAQIIEDKKNEFLKEANIITSEI